MIQRIQSLYLLLSSLFYFNYWFFGMEWFKKGFFILQDVFAEIIIPDFIFIIISFIPETIAIGFVVNSKSDDFTDYLLLFSQSLNIWRMPILFLISGMALSFSSVKRNNKELKEY